MCIRDRDYVCFQDCFLKSRAADLLWKCLVDCGDQFTELRPGHLTSRGSGSSTAVISLLNSVFRYIEVQSYAIRLQSEETCWNSINRKKCGVSRICVLFF